MIITKSKTYIRDYKNIIVKKHMLKESLRIQNIEYLLIAKENFYDLMLDPLHLVYGIEKKAGNLKTYYTAKVNDKLRLFIKPVAAYPYDMLEITEVIFESIDDKHYGEG